MIVPINWEGSCIFNKVIVQPALKSGHGIQSLDGGQGTLD